MDNQETAAAGPVNLCLVATYARGRLVVRRNDHRSAYVAPTGNIYPAPPICWPLLVIDDCPHCGAAHAHTIQTPGPRWYKIPPCCGSPYIAVLRSRP